MNIALPSADAEQIAAALAASSTAITVLFATVSKLPPMAAKRLRDAARQADVAGALLATHRPATDTADGPAARPHHAEKQAAPAAKGKRGAPKKVSGRHR
jgi:hypothetical protein